MQKVGLDFFLCIKEYKIEKISFHKDSYIPSFAIVITSFISCWFAKQEITNKTLNSKKCEHVFLLQFWRCSLLRRECWVLFCGFWELLHSLRSIFLHWVRPNPVFVTNLSQIFLLKFFKGSWILLTFSETKCYSICFDREITYPVWNKMVFANTHT